jgi:hypothetical protein
MQSRNNDAIIAAPIVDSGINGVILVAARPRIIGVQRHLDPPDSGLGVAVLGAADIGRERRGHEPFPLQARASKLNFAISGQQSHAGC